MAIRLHAQTPSPRPVSLDPFFDPNFSNTGEVTCVAVQPDGKILAGGTFTSVGGGVTHRNLARLTEDGAAESASLFPALPNNTVSAITVQPDGSILIAGDFTDVSGQPRAGIARLLPDGTVEGTATFNPGTGVSGGRIHQMILQPDGKILLGGAFTAINGETRNRIARLHPNGTLESTATFNAGTGATETVNCMALQPDGKILLGGAFLSVNGTSAQRLARLNSDGTVESSATFTQGRADGAVESIALLTDGRILAGGAFRYYNGQSRTTLTRLNADGTLSGFGLGGTFGGYHLRTIAVQLDGRILICGDFHSLSPSNANLYGVARLNSDGTVESYTTFPGGNGVGLSGVVNSIALRNDGSILAGGTFTSLGSDERNKVGMLRNAATVQQVVRPDATRLQWLRSGTGPEVGAAWFEQSTNNGTTWTSLGAAVRIAGGWERTGLNLPAGAKFRARGGTTDGTAGGGIVESTDASLPQDFAPAALNGRATLLTIATGTTPFYASGSYHFVPSSSDSSFSVAGSGTGNFAGEHTYTKTGPDTADLTLTSQATGLIEGVCRFITPSTGTYKLAGVSYGGLQTGTFSLFSGSAPASVQGLKMTVNVTSGYSPFAPGGSYRLEPAATGNTYTLTGLVGGIPNSNGTYEYVRDTSYTGLVDFADSVAGAGLNGQLSFDTVGTGIIILRNGSGSGSQTGTFALQLPPVLVPLPDLTVNEDTTTGPIAVAVSDSTAAGASLILTASSSNTTLVPQANLVLGGGGEARTLAITPAANQTGTTTITLTLRDADNTTVTDSFVLTVNPVNDAPVVSNITDKTTLEDTATTAIAFTVGDMETAAASLTVSGASSNPALVLPAGIVFGGSGANRTVTVTPLPNQSGTSTITVTAGDGTASVSDTFLLTVTAVNDLPTILDVPNQTVNEDTPTTALPFTIGDVETAADALTLTRSSSNTTLVPTANIVFSGTGASRFVTVSPAANQGGSATITLTVNDGTVTRSDTFTLTVTAVNDPPTISDVADRATNEDTVTAAIPFVIGDVETSTSSLTVTRTSSNTALVPLTGVVLGGSGANRTVTITPAANQFGTTSITLTVSDGTATVSDTFVLTVNPLNDLPVISNVVNLSTNEDTPTAAIAFTISDLETPLADLTMTGGSSNTALVPLTGFAFGGSAGSRTVTVSPALNQSGTSTITLTVSDGTATANDTFVLTVTAVNDAPTISDIADLTLIRSTASAAIPFTIGDVETAAASLTVTRSSSNTTLLPIAGVVLGGSGTSRTVTLTPAANQTGAATVTMTVSDGSLTRSDTFILTVTNLLPLAAWKQVHFGANAGNESIAGDLANPDGDLLVNLLEYALGGNPNSAASAPAPVSSVISNRVSLTFTRIVANTDVTITVQGADSLSGPWTDLAQSTGGNAMTVLNAGAGVTETGTGTTRSVEVRDSFTLGQASHPRRFLRVKAGH